MYIDQDYSKLYLTVYCHPAPDAGSVESNFNNNEIPHLRAGMTSAFWEFNYWIEL